ncbi:hypothetical protein RVBP21_2570 [Pseudomonas phage BRkr]|nr:hypothetical protein RVBP21_2570 [Pseudomonas phage BRkr]
MLNRSKGLFLDDSNLMEVKVINAVGHRTHGGPHIEDGSKYHRTLDSYEVLAKGYMLREGVLSLGINTSTHDIEYDGFGFINVFLIEDPLPHAEAYKGKHVILSPVPKQLADKIIKDDRNVGRLTNIEMLDDLLYQIDTRVTEALIYLTENMAPASPEYRTIPPVLTFDIFVDNKYVSIYAFESAIKEKYGDTITFRVIEPNDPPSPGAYLKVELTITK